MFDTVAISQTFARSPNVDFLVGKGCKPVFSKFTGEPYKLSLNGEKDSKKPRITISRNPKGLWVLKAEVSIGDWLFGSNLHLPEENNMAVFFSMLSEFVGDRTGRKFAPRVERVTRADITRDFQLGENQVLPIIAALGNVSIPKYNRQMFNDTGAYFENKGKKKNKKFGVYSKYDEMLANNANLKELAMAKGLVRLEIQHKNNCAVTNLAKSIKLPNHNADQILTRRVSEIVLERTMKLLNFAPLFENGSSQIETLFDSFDSLTALKLIGHLAVKGIYGTGYEKLPFINLSAKTIKCYNRQCFKAGILSLE